MVAVVAVVAVAVVPVVPVVVAGVVGNNGREMDHGGTAPGNSGGPKSEV